MRPIHLLVAVIVLAGAGVAWLLLNPGKDSGAVSSALPHSSTAAPEATKAKAQLDAVEPAATGSSASERVAIDSKPTAAPAAKAAVGKSADSVAVSGEVHDASGKPVNGAKVLAVCGRDGFTGDLPLDVEMPRFGLQRAARLEATTDAAGRFELANARPGSLQLAVRGAGLAPYDARNINVPAGERHDLGVITLETGVTLEGRVVDSRGRALVGARVQRLPEQRSSFFFFDGNRRPGITFATTRGDGTFSTDQLPSGPVTLRVLSDDHPDKSESLTSSRPGERLPNMTIVLDDGFEISGRVVGAPPEKVGTLRINASPSRAGQEEESDQGAAFEFPAAAGETRTAQCDSTGNFTVRGLRDGKRYGLRAVRDSEDGDFFGGGVSPRVTARSGDRGVELAYRPESALVFDVVDARTQEPIEEFTAEAGIEWREPFGARDGQSARKHPGGHLRFEGLRAKSADDKASLEINAVGYAKFLREDIELKPGADTDLGVIELQPVPVTRVTVLDGATGEPLAGARVTLRKVPEPEPALSGGIRARTMSVALSSDSNDEPADLAGFGDEDSVRGKTDEHGVAMLTSFEGARCTLDVTHGEHAPHRSEPFTCATGTPEERTVRMQRGGAVRVTLVDSEGVAIAGGRVEHRAPDAEPGSFMFGPESNAKDVTSAEGVVVFSHLAPGTHRFRPRGAGGPAGLIDGGNFAFQIAGMPDDQSRDTSWSEVVVADDATSELKLVAPKQVALTGLVRESGTPLSGAKLSLRARTKDGEREGMPMFFGGGPQAKTDGHGHYEFANVKAGEYTLTVDHATRQMPSELNVTVGEADTTFNVDLSVATIEGRVTGADNKPLAGVRMSVERSLGDGAPRQGGARVMVMRGNDGDGTVSFGDDGGGADKPALTDADGRYFLRGVLTDVDIVVKAQAKGYQAGKTEAFKLHANDARSGVDLSLKAAGRIEVSAFKADGTPASMVFVTARPDDSEQADGDRKQGFIQESGKTTLDGLSPGKWRVSARSMGPGARDGSGSPAEQVVEIDVDKPASVRFDMP